MKDLMKMQQQAKKMQDKLKNIHIEAEEGGVTVTINGNLEVMDIQITDDAWGHGKEHIRRSTMTAFQKGLKKAQEVASSNMKDILGDLGLPGNFGELSS